MYYVKAQTEMVEQSLPGPGKLRWYKKENKNVRNFRLHDEKLTPHVSNPNNGNLVITRLNNHNKYN
jgi:hypothetical protein